MITHVLKVLPDPNRRIIAISDIHGRCDHLVQLLRKVNYTARDILVINGDLLERGEDSLHTLQTIMDLKEKNEVYVTLGNMDEFILDFFWDAEPGSEGERRFVEHINWTALHRKTGLFQEMLKTLGLRIDAVTEENGPKIRDLLRERFRKEHDFLAGLPTIVEIGRYIFVHGGIPDEKIDEKEGRPSLPFTKNDNFLGKGLSFTRPVVVGHWPTCLYRPGEEDVSPVIDVDRNIASIDGGCGIKTAGQLNALLIPGCESELSEATWESYDEHPVVTALADQEGVRGTVHIQYPNNVVRPVTQTEEEAAYWQSFADDVTKPFPSEGYVTVVGTATEKTITAPAALLTREEVGKIRLDDYCDEILTVKAGDRLSVMAATEDGVYAKIRGKIGWYRGPVAEEGYTLTMEEGRPGVDAEAGRRAREVACYDFLDRLGIAYGRVDHREANTMEACRAVDEAINGVICKNLLLRNQQKTAFYMLMMHGEKKFKTKELSKQINSARLSFAEPEYMEEFLSIAPGSLSVLGLMNDTEHRVKLLIDRDVLAGDVFGCHPCVNTSSLRMSMDDLLQKFLPAVGHEPEYVTLIGEG